MLPLLPVSIGRLVVAAVLLLADTTRADSACRHPPYEVHIVSSSPLVVYLVGFITADERVHLQNVTQHSFVHSAVAAPGAADGRRLDDVRTSQSTSVPPDDVVHCLQQRALRFQGLLARGHHGHHGHHARVEPLQLVRYTAGERYHFHTDWFTDPVHAAAALGGNRASSFFAYVRVSSAEDDDAGGSVRGGGTNFPLLDLPDDDASASEAAWCTYVDCDTPWDHGVTFRPVEGNAVYWENLLPASATSGVRVGDARTLHAGLPVTRGEKIGLNIWTREDAALPADVRGW